MVAGSIFDPLFMFVISGPQTPLGVRMAHSHLGDGTDLLQCADFKHHAPRHEDVHSCEYTIQMLDHLQEESESKIAVTVRTTPAI